MKNVLTLIGATDAAPATLALRAAGATVGGADWLSPGEAADIPFDGIDPAAAEAAARGAYAGKPVDLLAQSAAGRRKHLLIADMDSTIIGCECIDELADFIGKKVEIAAITEAAMRGELDFPSALRRRVAMMAGLAEETMRRAYDERVRLNPGARTLVATMRKAGAFTALVSGGFTYFTSLVGASAGFDTTEANRLVFEDGKLAAVAEPIQGAEAKLLWLRKFANERGLAPGDTLAVGDGANDIPMIQAAGLGVAYRAKPRTAAAARARVDHGDLTALLYYQGYRRSDFAD